MGESERGRRATPQEEREERAHDELERNADCAQRRAPTKGLCQPRNFHLTNHVMKEGDAANHTKVGKDLPRTLLGLVRTGVNPETRISRSLKCLVLAVGVATAAAATWRVCVPGGRGT